MTTDDLYRRLQQHLDRMPVPFPATSSGVEIRILKALFTPEEARVALALSMMPESPDTIARRLRGFMTAEQVAEALPQMAVKGVVQQLPGTVPPRYCKAVFVVGFYEAQVNRLTEEFERDVLRYFDEAFGQALVSLRTPQMRTVPVNKPLASPEHPVARYDDIAEVVRTSKGPFAAMNCICQQGKDLLAEPCRQSSSREHCLMLGPAADWMVERGVAHFVSREEMLGLLERADRDGLVLQPQNTENPLFVCCCCGCCCGVLTTAKKMPKPSQFLMTNYYAEVNEGECHLCGTCIDRCQMEAIAAVTGAMAVKVDLDRCIGCGLCISTCTTGAMQLKAKPERRVPPRNTMALYERMFRDRYGLTGVAELVVRKAFGKPF